MTRTNRKVQGNRRENALFTRRSILVYCQGETERGYFSQFKIRCTLAAGGDALSFVKECIKHLARLPNRKDYDEIWLVFDKDETSLVNFNNAIKLAEKNKLKFAYSIQAFELWIILHYEYFDGKLARNKYAARIKKNIEWYSVSEKGEDQGKKLFFHTLDNLNNAMQNAERQFKKAGDHSSPASEESSTTIFKLIKNLLQ